MDERERNALMEDRVDLVAMLRETAADMCYGILPTDPDIAWLAADVIEALSCEHAVQGGVQRIKEMSKLRDPTYELPADSHIERVVRSILLLPKE